MSRIALKDAAYEKVACKKLRESAHVSPIQPRISLCIYVILGAPYKASGEDVLRIRPEPADVREMHLVRQLGDETEEAGREVPETAQHSVKTSQKDSLLHPSGRSFWNLSGDDPRSLKKEASGGR